MENTAKTIVLKPTGTVQIANKFSLIERKLINGIIWYSQKNFFDSEEYSLPIGQVFQMIGLENSRNYEVIKEALRTLVGTIIEWNIFGEDRTQEWGVCSFLATGKITRGRMKYRLNPEIVSKVKHPTLFAKIQLVIQSQFKKRHTLILYEFFIDCLSRNKVDQIVIEQISLDKVQKLLGMENTKSTAQGNYKFFNRDILKPSIEEINRDADIQVAYQSIRKQRRVAALSFTVERKASFQVLLNFENNLPLNEEEVSQDAWLIKKLLEMGVSLRKAKQLIGAHEPERIEANIQYVLHEQKQNNRIKNVAAYLVKAIEENYQLRKSAAADQELQAHRQQTIPLESVDHQAKLEREWMGFCNGRTREKFEAMPDTWKNQKRQDFLEQMEQEAEKGNHVMYKLFQREQYNSPLIEAYFFSQIRGELPKAPEETSLEEYLAWKQSQGDLANS